MTISQILILLIIGLAAGFASGIFGVGGGIVIVPALIFILGFSQHQAQGISLGILTLPVVAISAYNYYKNGYIDVKTTLIIVAAFVVGGYFGSILAVQIPAKFLRKIFAIFMILVGFKLLLSK